MILSDSSSYKNTKLNGNETENEFELNDNFILLLEELNSWNVVIVVGNDSNKHLKMWPQMSITQELRSLNCKTKLLLFIIDSLHFLGQCQKTKK